MTTPERRDLSGPRECDHSYREVLGGWQCRYCREVFEYDELDEIPEGWFGEEEE